MAKEAQTALGESLQEAVMLGFVGNEVGVRPSWVVERHVKAYLRQRFQRVIDHADFDTARILETLYEDITRENFNEGHP